jgi:hypothetical protein
VTTLALLGATVAGAARIAQAAEDVRAPVYLRNSPDVKQLERSLANEGEHRIAEARAAARRHAHSKKFTRRHGERVRPVRSFEGPPIDDGRVTRRPGPAYAAPSAGTFATPVNVRFNDPAADGALAAQSEVSVAMKDDFGVAAWNDGQGFITPPNGMGAGYTTDGGVTWTDAGLPPVGGATTITDWVSDPVVALNEKTGEFWFCGLTENGASHGGVAVVKATFPGGVFTWGTPHVVRDLPNATDLIDKQWLVADSTSGNLYLTFTHFISGGGDIAFARSIDNGITWSADNLLSNNFGFVQASRPVVAGNGALYVTWREIGNTDVDFVMVRRSLDHGQTFETQHTAASFYDNFGTGAPGFNRNRNVVEPCNAVDRSTGSHRGRLYVTVHESLNFYDDPLGGGGNQNEIENNNFFAHATPFTIGQRLRGGLTASTSDFDYFSFTATAGTSYAFWCDSIPRPLYTMRVFCGLDTLTRLSYGGDTSTPAGGQTILVWTAPSSGTYYLRMAYLTGGSPGNYRIETGVAAHGAEIGRDQRDVIVHYSDDGGTTWSGPVRANDDAALYDDFLPELGVTAEGYPYCAWYDYRDAASSCGGKTHVYVTRSRDGGATWSASQPVTTAQTAWTTAGTNIQPNMGDYIGLYAGGALALGWGDARSGEADVNVWGATVPIAYDLGCANDTTVTANSTLSVALPVTNHNTLYANPYDYAVSIDRSWPVGGGTGTVTVAANGGTGNIPFTITVPDTASGLAHVCVSVSLAGALVRRCCFTVTAQQANSVTDPREIAFGIHSVSPNPAARGLAVTFALPDRAPARLELLDVNGRRVAEREVGSLGAGLHILHFDREMPALPAGVYAIRLTRGDRAVTAKVSIVH